jgi:hypothetical protein
LEVGFSRSSVEGSSAKLKVLIDPARQHLVTHPVLWPNRRSG